MDQKTTYRLCTRVVAGLIKALGLLVGALVLYASIGFVAIAVDALAVNYSFLSDTDPILNSILFLTGIAVMIGSLSVVLRAKVARNNTDMRVVLFTGITGFAFGLVAVLASLPPF